MSETVGWWTAVEPPVADLAKRLASKRGLRPDDDCLPYPAYQVDTGSSTITVVARHDVCPVWSAFVALARLALETRDEQAIDAVAPITVMFNDQESPDDEWRKSRGLDGEAEG